MYSALANAVAADGALLEVAARARHGPVPNLFLAAVHDQLLRGRGCNLAAYYPTLVGSSALPPAGAPAAFTTFVLSDPARLDVALGNRLVQTNEVRRAGVLYLALAWLRARHAVKSAALVEVGTSAGLLLATDHYRIAYGPFQTTPSQPQRSTLALETTLRGKRPPAVDQPLHIAERIGIDLVTLDVSDAADRRWLRALIWGDQPERLARLAAAIDVARQTPLTLLEGDANEVLPVALATLPQQFPAVVFHSHTLNQFPADARERFDQRLRAASQTRDIYRVAMEGAGRHSLCAAACYRAGDLVSSTDLAHYDAHEAWIEWLA